MLTAIHSRHVQAHALTVLSRHGTRLGLLHAIPESGLLDSFCFWPDDVPMNDASYLTHQSMCRSRQGMQELRMRSLTKLHQKPPRIL